MLDDLRRSAEEGDSRIYEEEEDLLLVETPEAEPQLFLGMTPVERMFLSIFVFLNVAILGIALLMVTGRMG